MNSVVILLVRISAPRGDMAEAMRVRRRLLERETAPEQAAQPEPSQNAGQPLWTWFLPNPRPRASSMFASDSGFVFVKMNP